MNPSSTVVASVPAIADWITSCTSATLIPYRAMAARSIRICSTGKSGDLLHLDVGGAWDLAHDGGHLVRLTEQDVHVIAENLHRDIGAHPDAFDQLHHSKLDRLRDRAGNAWNLFESLCDGPTPALLA